jgi:hypothetical protein
MCVCVYMQATQILTTQGHYYLACEHARFRDMVPYPLGRGYRGWCGVGIGEGRDVP